MLDTRFQSRPTAIERRKRPDAWAVDIVKHSGMPADTCALYIELVDLPPTFEINQRYFVNTERYGGEKRVRRMFKDMIDAGRMQERPLRRTDGQFVRGIYEISDEPKWLSGCVVEAVDNCPDLDGLQIDQDAHLAEGNVLERRAANGRPGIDNSIVNPDTDTGPSDVEKPIAPELNADGRDRGRKSHLTGKAERRTGGAKSHLPQTEPRKGAAKGSAMRGFASGEGDGTSDDRYTERLVDQMIAAASFPGSRMPNPRKAARSIASLIQWRAEGFDFALDVLTTLADVCSRVCDPDKPIVSWHYFTGAIRDAHARRTRAVSRPKAPLRPVEGWTPAGAALVGGRRR